MTGRWNNLLTLVNRSCLSTFGVPVTYTPIAGDTISLVGVFNEKWENITLMGTNGMEAVVPHPVVEIRVADLGIDPMAGDEVIVDELTYRILDVQLDGRGMALLHLVKSVDAFSV